MGGKNNKRRKGDDARNRKWKSEEQSIRDFQRRAPAIKAALRKQGIELPFYDYLDSYPDEFRRIAAYAKAMYPRLLGVHEVERSVYEHIENHWRDFGYEHLRQVFFNIDDAESEYLKRNKEANINGSMITFRDEHDGIHCAIVICKSVSCSFEHSFYKYVVKIPALCHEIGHVHDLEHGSNFDVENEKLDVIEAEVSANLFALNLLAERNLQQSYNILANAMREAAGQTGYLGQVATKVVERMPRHEFIDWQKLVG
jgi:hypothetical protein